MSHEEKIAWMADWCVKNGLVLKLESECGIGRGCVGVVGNESFPSYEWIGDDYERIDANGDVWTPPNAYHKHPCVAVLGRGEEAESQLFDWLQWFDANGFVVEQGEHPGQFDEIDLLFGKDRYCRMVRKGGGQ